MGIFDSLKKPAAESQKEQRHVDIHPDDQQTFEKICALENIECSYQQLPDGSIRCTFDADRWPTVEGYLSPLEPVPSSEEKKGPSLDERIAGTKKAPEPTQTRQPSYLEKMGLAEEVEPASSTEAADENQWAEEKLTEDLKDVQKEIEEAAALMAAEQGAAPEGSAQKKRRKRKSLGRVNQIKTRLTDSELIQFQRRVKKSGLSQGDYLRSVALTGKIVIEERSMTDLALLDELVLIRAELGRQGGLLKMIVKPNEGQRELAPAEWDQLMEAIRGFEKMKKRISDLEVNVYGNRNPSNE